MHINQLFQIREVELAKSIVRARIRSPRS